MTATRVALAGSTGSIGTQTLEVLAAEPDRFELVALGASGRQPEVLDRPGPQATGPRSWPSPTRRAAAAGRRGSARVRGPGRRRRPGQPGRRGRRRGQRRGRLRRAAGHPRHARGRPPPGAGQQGVADRRRSGRAAGPPHAGGRAGAGRQRALRHPPVPAGQRRHRARVARLVLTASGGPFRGRTADDLAEVTVDDALAHPTWSMGPKITVDSSTLMNKGLEVIEAHELFGEPAGDARRTASASTSIDVVVHPQSIVHSMVEFTDGATIAQLSMPDMRLPDRLRPGLARPHRHPVRPHRLDRSWAGSTSSRPTSTPSRASAWPTPPAAPAAPPRPGSTPPTRSRSRRSSTAASLGRHRRGDRRHPRRPRRRPGRRCRGRDRRRRRRPPRGHRPARPLRPPEDHRVTRRP